MAKTNWKKIKVDKWRDLWTKGSEWIHIDDPIVSNMGNNEFVVGASTIINPKTENGHFRFYKTKSQAMIFVKSYMKKY